MKVQSLIVALMLFSLGIASCQNQHEPTLLPGLKTSIKPIEHYNFDQPDQNWKLNYELNEISALEYFGTDSLFTVNDEIGTYYILDANTGKVIANRIFHSNGDYEGIALVGREVFVLKSNGNLYRCSIDDTKEAEKISSPLTDKNDCEGLAYDATNQQLLIACKGDPMCSTYNNTEGRAIYTYSLSSKQWSTQPVLLIKPKEIAEQLELSKKERKSLRDFAPSGIAIHPITHNWFVLGHQGKSIIEFNAQGEIVALTQLDPTLFAQPEGISFAPDGTLFISNEAAGGKPSLLKFSYQP